MRHADLHELESRVRKVVLTTPLAERVSRVAVEEAEDELGSEFLRIVLHFTSKPHLRWPEFEPIVRAIEDAVASIDERFPSVRIAEAA